MAATASAWSEASSFVRAALAPSTRPRSSRSASCRSFSFAFVVAASCPATAACASSSSAISSMVDMFSETAVCSPSSSRQPTRPSGRPAAVRSFSALHARCSGRSGATSLDSACSCASRPSSAPASVASRSPKPGPRAVDGADDEQLSE